MLLTVLQVVSIAVICGAQEKFGNIGDKLRIYGGQHAPNVEFDSLSGYHVVQNIGEFPYLISLENRGHHYCGGALIKNNAVLTAAHCVDGTYPDLLTIRAGSVIRNEKSSSVQIQKVEFYRKHDYYNPETVENDIAIIKTVGSFELGKFVNIIKLPNGGDAFYNRVATIIGWGETEKGESATILKKASLTIIDKDSCERAFGYALRLYYSMLCGLDVSQRLQGLCSGDSGGPTVIQNPKTPGSDILIGLNSWVIKPGKFCEPKYPSVVTSVARMKSWIDIKLKNEL